VDTPPRPHADQRLGMGFASWEYGIGVRACGDCVSCFEEILSGCTAYEQRCLVRIAGRIAPGTDAAFTSEHEIRTGEQRLDIYNLQTKPEALRCQLTDEHVTNEKSPARTVHVRKYAALSKQWDSVG
jgi:hypothetical protein